MKIFISTCYSLYSYFVSPYFFTDKYSTSTRSTSFLIFTPLPSIMYSSKQTIPLNSTNVSEHEIKQFIEKIKKYSFKPSVINRFEEL